jgi:hypothetical protein
MDTDVAPIVHKLSPELGFELAWTIVFIRLASAAKVE